MCHCLLPKRAQNATGPHRLAGRYLDESLVWVQGRMCHYGTAPRDYEAGLFGGSVVSTGAPSDVGLRNVEAARHLLSAGGWDGWREDVLGAGNRQLRFDLSSGLVSVSFHAPGQLSRSQLSRR
jgi:chemotaxis protein CheD